MAAPDPRQRLIDTASIRFYQQGYLATGVNQIIAEAGVAKATFYHHFPSKEDLGVAYLQARHTLWMEWLRVALAPYTAPTEKIAGLFAFLRDWMTRCNFRGCAFLNMAAETPAIDHRLRHEVIRHKDALRHTLNTLLLPLNVSMQAPRWRNVERIADPLYVIVEGAIVASRNYARLWPIDAAEAAAVGLYFDTPPRGKYTPEKEGRSTHGATDRR